MEVGMGALSKCIAATAGVVVLASSAFAAGGKYEGLLLQALMANAAGECPASLMREELKNSCDSQLPDLKEKFAKLGAFKEISFQSTRPLDGGPAEVYKVSFEHGEWIWVLNAQSDGKMFWAFAPNPPTWDIGSFSRKVAER
jgi:hypothetical protein